MPAATDTARIRRMRATAQLLAGPPAHSVAAVPRQLLAGGDLDAGGQPLVHLLFQSGSAGATVRGPVVRGRQTFVLTRDWLGNSPARELRGADRDRALAELARRYLRGHGPATPADLALWAGLPLRDA